jgi:hypothetical protein
MFSPWLGQGEVVLEGHPDTGLVVEGVAFVRNASVSLQRLTYLGSLVQTQARVTINNQLEASRWDSCLPFGIRTGSSG